MTAFTAVSTTSPGTKQAAALQFPQSLHNMQACEAMAMQISQQVDIPERTEVPAGILPSQRSQSKHSFTRADAVAELQRLPGAIRAALREVVARGAAFHHAGKPDAWIAGC